VGEPLYEAKKRQQELKEMLEELAQHVAKDELDGFLFIVNFKDPETEAIRWHLPGSQSSVAWVGMLEAIKLDLLF
jgi:hypothetical protein